LFFVILLSVFSLAHAVSYEMSCNSGGMISGGVALDDRASGIQSNNNVVFDLTHGSGLLSNTSAQQAFNDAAGLWSSFLLDDVTIKLDLDFAPLGAGVLGETGSTQLYGDYDEVRDMVVDNHGETNNQREASLLPNMPTYNQFNAYGPEGFELDGNMSISQANYHALGGADPEFTGSDGSITFSSDFSWDFDPSDGIDSGKYDFVGVAAHEIGHALGFISDVDYIDSVLETGEISDSVRPTPIDLFRFEKDDVLDAEFDFTTSARDMTPGGDDVFYFGDGFAELSTGIFAGDGRQASHWKDNLELGLMDPTASFGEMLSLSINDFIAMDLIGWEVDWQAANEYIAGQSVPEPASVLLLAIGAIAVIRKRKVSLFSC